MIKLHMPIQQAGGGDVGVSPMMVIQDDMYFNNNVHQTVMTWSRSGHQITVNFVSPKAAMEFYEARFSIVHNPANEIVPGQYPILASVAFYDAQGQAVTQSTPTESHFSLALE